MEICRLDAGSGPLTSTIPASMPSGSLVRVGEVLQLVHESWLLVTSGVRSSDSRLHHTAHITKDQTL